MLAGNKPSDCIRMPLSETLPTRCQQLKKGYGDCKRGMIDMRKRFRGNKPIATSTEIEGGNDTGSGMLYAGIGEKKKSTPEVADSGSEEASR